MEPIAGGNIALVHCNARPPIRIVHNNKPEKTVRIRGLVAHEAVVAVRLPADILRIISISRNPSAAGVRTVGALDCVELHPGPRGDHVMVILACEGLGRKRCAGGTQQHVILLVNVVVIPPVLRLTCVIRVAGPDFVGRHRRGPRETHLIGGLVGIIVVQSQDAIEVAILVRTEGHGKCLCGAGSDVPVIALVAAVDRVDGEGQVQTRRLCYVQVGLTFIANRKGHRLALADPRAAEGIGVKVVQTAQFDINLAKRRACRGVDLGNCVVFGVGMDREAVVDVHEDLVLAQVVGWKSSV